MLFQTVSFQNPAISDVYTEHSCATNVAKYSPSGFYIASGGTVALNTLFDARESNRLLSLQICYPYCITM
jgi:hypothetical protein